MDSIPSPQSFIFSDDYLCQWDSCLKNFDDAEMLYEHLRDEHVGRKAHHNLCLTCKWDKCNLPTFTKRDHITSHLRVHVASKPYRCDLCRKGFKRPQDLKKHEKTHQDNPGELSPMPNHEQAYQPLTPPSHLDRSPSIASSTISSVASPYNMPLSPASMADSTDSSWNQGLSSPSYSTSSDLYSSPSAPDLELDMLNAQPFGRHNIDVSGAYYGAFPSAGGYEDMVSPMSAKRPRDGFDDVLSDTLGSFALEAKKKRLDPSYNEDMMGRLNALSAILEVNPLTPDRLLNSLQEVNDWNQFNQFNQFCSTLFEDVSGEVFEPQTFDTPLFPDYEQKQNPVAMDTAFSLNNPYPNISNTNTAAVNANFGFSTPQESIYSTVLPDDPFVTPAPWGMQTGMASTITPAPGVVRSAPARSIMQQPNPFNQQHYVSLPSLQNRAVKVEPKEEVFEPKVEIKVERTYADMSTQTKAKEAKYAAEAAAAAEGGMMIRQRPAEEKRKQKTYETTDPSFLLHSIPAVPDTPLPNIEIQGEDEDEMEEQVEAESVAEEAPAVGTTASTTKYGGYVEKARARQAAAAAASSATASEPLDPLEAMTRQLAQTRLEDGPSKMMRKPPTTKPVTEGDMERQIKAAKARSMCSQDPVRKQHAEVVLNLLKSIDTLMADHRLKVAQWKETHAKEDASSRPAIGRTATAGAYGNRASAQAGVMYPRTNVNVPNQGPIRTVSSYLPRRTSPLHQDHSRADPDYSQLRSNLKEGSASYSSSPAVSSAHAQGASSAAVAPDSPVLYPTSDLHYSSAEPFELSEEERRFIEEDTAKIEAAASSGYQYIHA